MRHTVICKVWGIQTNNLKLNKGIPAGEPIGNFSMNLTSSPLSFFVRVVPNSSTASGSGISSSSSGSTLLLEEEDEDEDENKPSAIVPTST